MRSPPTPLRRARAAVAVAFFVNAAVVANWVPRIAEIKSDLNLSPGELGLALFGLPAGAVGALQIAGPLITRVGSRRTIRASALLLCAMLPLLTVAWSVATLWLALALLGAAAGLMDVAMNTHGVSVEKRYGRSLMASFHGLFSVGGAAGALAGGIAAGLRVNPLTQFVIAAVVLGVVVSAAAHWLLPVSADGVDESHEARATGATVSLWSRTVLLLAVIAFCTLVGEGAVSDWSSVYLRQTLGAGPDLAGAGYFAFASAMAVTRFAGDRLIVRFGPSAMVRTGGAVAAVGFGTALLLGDPASAVAGFGLFGVGLSLIIPITFSAAGRLEATAGQRAIARVAAFGYLGSFVGPPLIGFVADALHGLGAALAIPALLAGGAALCARAVAPAAADRDTGRPPAAGTPNPAAPDGTA